MKKFNFILLVIIFLSGCDILSTRDPEKPQQQGTSLPPATIPAILFQNLINSFEKKVTDNYLSCLADSSLINEKFKFIPDGSAINKYSIFENWNRESERRYFNNLKNNIAINKPITISLLNEVSNNMGEEALYQYDYIITFENSTLGTEIYKGIAEFRIKIDRNNIWVITEWTDRSISGFNCWSDLKGRYYL